MSLSAPRSTRTSLVTAVAVIVCWHSNFARADRAEDENLAAATAHAERAKEARTLGDLALAISEYEQSLDALEDPDILFQLAETEYAAGKISRAKDHYQQYLLRDPSGDHSREVSRRLNQLDEAAAKPTPKPALQVTASPVRRPVALIASGGTLLVAGFITLLVGAYYAASAASATRDLEQLDRARAAFDPAIDARRSDSALGAGLGLGLGMAAMTTGLLLVIPGARAAKASR